VGGARRSRRSADPGETGSWLITRAREVSAAVGGAKVHSVSDRPCYADGPELTDTLSRPSGSRLQVLPVQPVRLDGTTPAPIAQRGAPSPGQRLRAVLENHPGIAALLKTRDPLSPHALALAEAFLAPLHAAGLTERQAVGG
jgi:Tetracyclin repressor-like, C-terminal domain